MSDTIAGRPEEEAKDALRIMCSRLGTGTLQSLNVSDNALGEKGVRACATALTDNQQSLRKITLENVGLSVHACAALAELLPAPTALSSIRLANNMSDNAGALSIAALCHAAQTTMTDFRMWYCRVGDAGGRGLVASLSRAPLVHLDLGGNPMGPGVGAALGAALAPGSGATLGERLETLNLCDTLLTDEGVAHLVPGLAACPRLTRLDLGLNEVTARGARALVTGGGLPATLEELGMDENELGTRGAVLVLGACVHMPALSVVRLQENQLRDAAGRAALALVRRRRESELSSSSSPSMSSVVTMKLDGNFFSEEMVEQLMEEMGLDEEAFDLNDAEEAEEEEEEEEGGGEGEGEAGVLSAAMNALGLSS